jgi:hypothetical protein
MRCVCCVAACVSFCAVLCAVSVSTHTHVTWVHTGTALTKQRGHIFHYGRKYPKRIRFHVLWSKGDDTLCCVLCVVLYSVMSATFVSCSMYAVLCMQCCICCAVFSVLFILYTLSVCVSAIKALQLTTATNDSNSQHRLTKRLTKATHSSNRVPTHGTPVAPTQGTHT